MGNLTKEVDSWWISIDRKSIKWNRRVNILPHRCLFTGKWIRPFSKVAVRGIRKPRNLWADSWVEAYWTTSQELVYRTLKGDV